MPKSGFILDQIMHLHINFNKLDLTQGSSYSELTECEGVYLTLPPHIFSVQVTSGVCYITGQWIASSK